MFLLFLLIVSGKVVFSSISTSKTFYVCPSATGTESGDSWTNSFVNFPNSIERDSTYFLCTGNYDSFTNFGDGENKEAVYKAINKWVVIKKATETDHGTSDGWKSSYGTGQAVISGQWSWRVVKKYLVNGSYPYGILFEPPAGSYDSSLNLWSLGDNLNGVYEFTIEYVEFSFKKAGPLGSRDVAQNAIRDYACSGAPSWCEMDKLIVRRCYFHDMLHSFALSSQKNAIYEYNVFENFWSSSSHHGEIMASYDAINNIFRFNLMINATGTSFLALSGSNGFRIYGNIFYNEESFTNGVGNGCIGSVTNDGITNFKIYNNHFFNVEGQGIYCGTTSSGNHVYNNLFYEMKQTISCSQCVHEYNFFIDNENAEIDTYPQISVTNPDIVLKNYLNNELWQIDNDVVKKGKDLSKESWWSDDYDRKFLDKNKEWIIGLKEDYRTFQHPENEKKKKKNFLVPVFISIGVAGFAGCLFLCLFAIVLVVVIVLAVIFRSKKDKYEQELTNEKM